MHVPGEGRAKRLGPASGPPWDDDPTAHPRKVEASVVGSSTHGEVGIE